MEYAHRKRHDNFKGTQMETQLEGSASVYLQLFNRPGVAGAVLQTPLLLINSFSQLVSQAWKMSEILPEQDFSFQILPESA